MCFQTSGVVILGVGVSSLVNVPALQTVVSSGTVSLQASSFSDLTNTNYTDSLASKICTSAAHADCHLKVSTLKKNSL